MRTRLVPALLVIGACAGEATDTTPKDVTDPTGDTGMETTETGTPVVGFRIEATALDASTTLPATEGLCVDLLDPTPVLAGGDPLLLGQATVGKNGAFAFDGVVTDTVLGLLMSVKDCKVPNTDTFTSATGIQYESIKGLNPGDVLASQTAFVITMEFLDGMQQSLVPLGFKDDLAKVGVMFGYTLDTTAAPVGGATVTCKSCGPTFYLDTDPLDGLFTTGAAPNTATDPAAGAWLIPAGPVGSYTVDDGGAHTWIGQLNGSNPGSATITAFFGQ